MVRRTIYEWLLVIGESNDDLDAEGLGTPTDGDASDPRLSFEEYVEVLRRYFEEGS